MPPKLPPDTLFVQCKAVSQGGSTKINIAEGMWNAELGHQRSRDIHAVALEHICNLLKSFRNVRSLELSALLT